MQRILPICLISFFFIIGTASGATYFVPDDYPTIQGAIDASVTGDTIIVRAGTYPENINLLGKGIIVKREFGPESTIIDGGDVASVVVIDAGGPDTVLDGFTLTNGNASFGGGIMCPYSSPTLVNNIITGNHAGYYGGGIYLEGGEPILADSIIESNTCTEYGAGLYTIASDFWMYRTTVRYNTSNDDGGGGAVTYGYPVVENCVFYGNVSGDWGGGLRLTGGHQNSDEDVEYVLEVLPEIVENLRELNQLQMRHAS